MHKTEEAFSNYGLPKMRPPADGEDYVFPAEVHELTDYAMASLAFKLRGWFSLSTQKLAVLASDIFIIEETYDLALGVKMHQIAEASEKRINKESLQALAVHRDEDLKATKRVLIEKKALYLRLEAQVRVFEEQIRGLSREQTRREKDHELGT